jgi:hypothetical protein
MQRPVIRGLPYLRKNIKRVKSSRGKRGSKSLCPAGITTQNSQLRSTRKVRIAILFTSRAGHKVQN